METGEDARNRDCKTMRQGSRQIENRETLGIGSNKVITAEHEGTRTKSPADKPGPLIGPDATKAFGT